MERIDDKYQVKILGIEDYRALTACQSACPLETDTKTYLRAIAEGDDERAFLVARQTNPFVSVCSRVCTAPCEKACRKSGQGGPVAIRALKRFACDRHGVASPRQVAARLDAISRAEGLVGDRTGSHIATLARPRQGSNGQPAPGDGARVAIVGSGPAGLSAAHDLALLGYRVTVFEASSEPGGQLMTGIPAFRLPKEIVRQEIQAILDLGVELKLEAPIGKEVSLADLRAQGFQAIFVAVGLQAPLRLALEGSELRGVHHGIDYVRDHDRVAMEGKTCLVIGGGGVAIDCAQHALRRGASRVAVACLESWEAMPASLSDRRDAQEEGIEFHPSLGPQRIVGRGGAVTGVEFLAVRSVLDAEGRFNPSFVPGSASTLPADVVILAVGQSSTVPSLPGMAPVATTPQGLIRANPDLSTNVAGVFAGGDDRWRFGRNATDAIADGQKAARAIHAYLAGKEVQVRRRAHFKAVPPDFVNTGCDRIPAAEVPRRAARERVRTEDEIAIGFGGDEARQQAARCRRCNVQTVFEPARCLLCGTCVETCSRGALRLVPLTEVQRDVAVTRVTQRLGKLPPGARGRTAILRDDARCVSCGMCARRCPGGAITMAEFYCEEDWE